mgnify:CR=1 FL=1
MGRQDHNYGVGCEGYGVTGSDFGIYDDISTKSEPFSSANNGNLDFAKNGIVYKNEKENIYYLNKDKKFYLLIVYIVTLGLLFF